ncbi:prephenate dehydrogenase (NADP+) [Cryptococcus neoformans var. grubii Br795]|nr:prephenate dehydrogenase (NADP+) [Cryptococcus neoformans var. grubii 125.91]OXG45095.1 prephenate dehydrogenase (NADP+) [Cryptococcus neoformans var. grubii Th84]OXG73223.1 prephenate dehydrogenase (NADP+) [Cryptococcus neoformans var. grubii MW-RSA36]OXG74223.1 prephenate dehydrogenase (NADP+) [Cryptococcus neoformans var. grubii Br795]OXH01986.1 prephenate dehydrogenase (NADP+) [Cryptococcus neoformans var. grubii]OXL05677.1 prephenate dehydrogenase (NADP+) [Cryptococcus neoformans var. 
MSDEQSQPVVGIIGMGDMGRMYAKRLHAGGIKTIYVCDKPDCFDALKEEFKGTGIHVLRDGHAVSRLSTFIIYSVEAAALPAVVKEYGPSTRVGAVVAGQTSVKAPEREAFEKWLPEDVGITSVHSLHGPSVTTEGQPLIIIHHRGPEENVEMVENVFRSFKSRYVYLSYEEHDKVTANTQAVTHAAFLSMGTAWQKSSSYPWETTRYVSGIEVIKVNITLRIYSAKWHVYAGLALLNPSAKSQIQQYATSATELFKLMVEGRGEELEDRIWGAREEVFGWRRGEEAGEGDEARAPILLSEDVLDQFSLGKATEAQSRESPNSHLSLLAMVDCWAKLGIRPYEHLDVAGTPVFMLWIGVAEYLFRSPALLSAALRAALSDRVHRPDDVEFVVAARGWSECVDVGNFGWYRRRFEETSNFFAPRFDEATKLGGKMIKAIQDGMRGR